MIASIDDLIQFVRRRRRACRLPSTLDPVLLPDDLPDPLAALYRAVGGWMEPAIAEDSPCLFAAHHRLVPLSELEQVGDRLEFATDNLGVWTCRCAPGPGDPPVYAAEYWEGPTDDSRVVSETLSDFLITFCLMEEVYDSQCVAASITAPTDTMRDRLAATGKCLFWPDADLLADILDGDLVPIWLNGRHVSTRVSYCFYQVAGTDMLVMTDHNSVRTGGTEEELARHLRRPETLAIECRNPVLIDDGHGPVQAVPFRLAVLRELLLDPTDPHTSLRG